MSTSKSERTRQRILDAAARVFSRGYAGASLSAIASEAGIQPGSIYYYFSSADDLMVAVMELGSERGRHEIEDGLAELGPDADPVEGLRVAVRAHLRVALRDSDYTKANIRVMNQVPEHLHARNLPEARAYGKLWGELLDRLEATGRIRPGMNLSVVRMLLFGAMNWAIEWYRPDGPLSPEAVADQLVELALTGILTPLT